MRQSVRPMSEIHAGWIDFREHASSAGVRAVPRPGTAKVDPDAAIAFVLFLTMLFAVQLGTVGAAIFTLVSVAYGASRRKQLCAALLPRALLLVFPLIAILSTVWSEQPLMTLKYSLEFALTAFTSLLLSASARPKSVIEGIFVAFAVFVVISLGLGRSVWMGANGDTAFAGISESKNALADLAACGFLISGGAFFIGVEDRKPS